MLNDLVTAWCRRLGGKPCFRIHGKARGEAKWRVIDVFAVRRRNLASRWPLWGGTCTTWSDRVIAVGWDFAAQVLCEQRHQPASRQHPVEVRGGRMGDGPRRLAAGAASFPSASEVLAHECGHTGQARRLGILYLPLVGSVTLCREGPYFWNHFENQASEEGLFGGIVNGSVCADLMERRGPR
jgi:hypothetical protein